jgi:hypothetical protein
LDKNENIIYTGGYNDYLTKNSLIPFFLDWNSLMVAIDAIIDNKSNI